MGRYCVNLVLSWNTLISPSMVIESFAGYSSLDWHLCFLRVCITSVQDILIFLGCSFLPCVRIFPLLSFEGLDLWKDIV